MSYYILAHRRKRVAALDLGNAFTIGIIARGGAPVGLLVERDPEDDTGGESDTTKTVIGVDVVAIVQAGRVITRRDVAGGGTGDIPIKGETPPDIEVPGKGDGDSDVDAELPPDG